MSHSVFSIFLEIAICIVVLYNVYKNMHTIVWESSWDTVGEIFRMGARLWEGVFAIYGVIATSRGYPLQRVMKSCKFWQVVYVLLIGIGTFSGPVLCFSVVLGFLYATKLVNGKIGMILIGAVIFSVCSFLY